MELMSLRHREVGDIMKCHTTPLLGWIDSSCVIEGLSSLGSKVPYWDVTVTTHFTFVLGLTLGLGLGEQRGQLLPLLWDRLKLPREQKADPCLGLPLGCQHQGRTPHGSHWCRQSQRRNQPHRPPAAVLGHQADRWRMEAWKKGPRRAQ